MIQVESLHKSYGEVKENNHSVLNGITCEIDTGKWTTVVGPSGSGKTTFLKCLSGIEKISSGEVIFFGEKLSHLSEKANLAIRRKQLSFVFQEYNLIDDLKIVENITFEHVLTPQIEGLIQKWGIEDILYKFPAECSGGQQQKAAILRALLKGSKVIFCDEPTGASDTKSSIEVLKTFKEVVRENNVTIVMVTHNPLIEQLSDCVITLHDGTIKSYFVNETPKSVEEIPW
ncbi:MAG TPA: ABC transporter ATP-binding protein [Flavobacteriaceae bacterium]|nr:ABC transporter ATP-binding protein [Flavobacteriaceae bacterium]